MIPGSANPLLLATAAGAAGGYAIERSLRFNSADSAYLSRTPASAGNRKTWTWAGWVKRTVIGQTQALFGNYTDGSNFSAIRIINNYVQFVNTGSGGTNPNVTTPNLLRDPSAWYHIVFALDTTQATSSNRVRVYINGVQLTTSGTYPDQNADLRVNTASLQQNLGAFDNSGGTGLNGYLADVHFIDGQALDPTSFGEFDANGIWQPIEYSGTYGTNGFHLPFSDNSTAASLGDDTSGNNNDWTVNNISVASGAGNDSLVDSPTNGSQTDTGVGGEVTGNYATWNPLDKGSVITLANGNLDASTTAADWNSVRATIGVSSGKYYWEVTSNTTLSSSHTLMVGIGNSSMSVTSYIGSSVDGKGYYAFDGNKYPEVVSYGATYTLNDVIGVALDMDAGTLTFYKNGVSQGQSHSGLTGTWFPALSIYGTASTTLNTGARPFAYPAPSGFKALCTTNLPAPVVAKPSSAFDVKLYTGNGTSQTISGLGFSPDLVWIKSRSNGSYVHELFDTVRGAGYRLVSNLTNAEAYNANYLQQFNSDGFQLGSGSSENALNETYVAWCFDAGSNTVSNTQGSITSQVRANASAGFSVVTFSASAGATIGHGLGVAPQLIIAKSRTSGSTDWAVYSSVLGRSQYLLLNSTSAAGSLSNYWGTADPTSTVFGVYSSTGASNNAGDMVAYCFAPVAGYSSGFSYTGNGSTDGSFVYLGFRPRLILLKCSSTTGNWTLVDTAREGYNVDNDPLYPNLSNAEGTTDLLDITSNGFKLRTTDASVNSSGATYVGFAWAELPFKTARAR